MNDRPVKRQPDDRELRKAFQRLAAQQPDEVQAQHALDLARQTLEREKQSHRTSAPASRDAGRGSHFWFWRIAMPVSLLTAAALVMAFLFTSATPQVASAAEILERAAHARAEFEGWYSVELFDPETGRWHVRQRANPSEQKHFLRLDDSPEELARPILEGRWVYMDGKAPLTVIYRASTRQAVIRGGLSSTYSDIDIPLTEDQMREWAEGDGRYTVETRRGVDGDVRLEFVKRPQESGGENEVSAEDAQWPVRVELVLDQTTGLLGTISMQRTVEEELTLWARMVYHTQPIQDWRNLIDDSVAVDDKRPDVDTEKLLQQIDAVWDGGLGFDTALLVSRSGDPLRGNLREHGRLTLYGELGDERVKFQWEDGQNIPGWPEPTLGAVLEHLETHPPESVTVVADGRCWWRWSDDQPWQEKPRKQGAVESIVQSARLIGEIWPERSEILYDPGNHGVQPTVQRHPEHSNGVILETVSLSQWTNKPQGELQVGQKREYVFLKDLGPLPIKDTREIYNSEGEIWSRTEVEYSFVDKQMYRYPVRVPLYWRSTQESPRSKTLPKFFHLLPQPGVQLDVKWFSDPTGRWPQQKNKK